MVPELVTLPLPVYEVPGDNPTSPPAVPEIVVAPVFVIVLPARIPYVVVVPGRIVGLMADNIAGPNNIDTATTAIGIPTRRRDNFVEKLFAMPTG